MKVLAAGFGRLKVVSVACLSLFLVQLTPAIAATAQPDKTIDDQAAIRATITDYIEGYYLNDPARMERSLHPHYLKHTVSESNGELKITDKTGMEMVQGVRDKDVTPVSERKEEITILDVNGDIAAAKLVAAHWTDYITLAKQNGQWKILSVVLRGSKSN